MNWRVQVIKPYVHVVPTDDLRAHEVEGVICWCDPEVDEGMVVHNSLDKREKYETGERKPS